MQLVVTALVRSLPLVMDVFLFGLVIFLIYSILGVQLFAGKLYSCNQAVTNPHSSPSAVDLGLGLAG